MNAGISAPIAETSTVSILFAILLFAMPGVLLTGRRSATWVLSGSLSTAVAPCLALCIWLLSIHCLALATHSFFTGLTFGTLLASLICFSIKANRFHRSDGEIVGQGSATRTLLIILIALPSAWMAIGWNFHDEFLLTGHRSIPAQLLNNIYPPHHLSFPIVELGYHYGINVFVAAISAILHIPVWMAVDLASISLWILTAALVGELGDRLLGQRRGWVTMLTVLFGGGIPYCLASDAKGLLLSCTIDNIDVAVPLISNFFQHPWALGYPISIAAFGVFIFADRGAPRLATLAILLITLSFCQTIMFVALFVSLGLAELFLIAQDRRWQALPALLGTGVVVGCFALILGGFFRAAPWQTDFPIALRMGVAPGNLLLWHWQSFGLMLPLGIIGFATLPLRAKLPLFISTFVCLVAVNFIEYKYSHDSVKFAAAASLTLGIGTSAAIVWLAKRLFGALIGILPIITSTAGLALSFAFLTMHQPTFEPRHFSNSDDAKAASFLRSRVHGSELVYRRPPLSRSYTVEAGLPTVWIDWAVSGFGYPLEWTLSRAKLLFTLPKDSAAWRTQGIVWFVLDDEDVAINSTANLWIEFTEADELARFGSIRVVKLR